MASASPLLLPLSPFGLDKDAQSSTVLPLFDFAIEYPAPTSSGGKPVQAMDDGQQAQQSAPRTTAPPQNLRFVVANDPDQFRDRSTMRSNRSHVMHNHLTEKRNQESPRVNADASRIQKRQRSATPSQASSRTGSPPQASGLRRLSGKEQTISSLEALAIYRRTQDPKARRPSRTGSQASAGGRTRGDRSRSSSRPLESPGMLQGQFLASSPPILYSQPPGLLYCETPDLAAKINEMYIRSQSTLDMGTDTLSGASDIHARPRIDVQLLRNLCLGHIRETGTAFPLCSPCRTEDWAPALGALSVASPHLIFAWENASLRTTSDAVTAEAMSFLQQSFQTPDQQVTSPIVLAVTCLIARALIDGDSTLTRVHEEGLLKMCQLDDGVKPTCIRTMTMVLSVISLSAIMDLRQPDPFWVEKKASLGAAGARQGPLAPHSPLFFPSSGFGSLFDSSTCRERTHGVLRAACDLTTHANEVASGLHYAELFDSSYVQQPHDLHRQQSIQHIIDDAASAVYSACQSPHNDDFVLEACRIAAAIYATSISRRMPFSQAANVVHQAGIVLMPVQNLVYALQQTDIAGCWENMCGVLLWITVVGGAAAPDPPTRSWLLSIAVRCCSVLLLERGAAVVDSLGTLLTIMQLWQDVPV